MFATLISAGSSGAATQTACGRSARAIRRTTIACSSRSLSERRSCSPRWSSTAGSAERRVEPASATVWARCAVAADQQLRRGGDEGGVAAAGAEDVAGLEAGAQDAEDRGGVVRRRRLDGHLAREHDLLERARADALDGARDGRLVVLGRRDGVDPEAAGGRRVEQRQRREPQRRGAGAQALGELLRHVVRRRERGEREPDVVAAARQRDLRARPGRRPRSPTSAARARRRARRRSRRARRGRRRAGRPARRRRRPRVSSRQAAATCVKRSGPDAVSRVTVPSAASAEPSRSGCSKQNQSSPGARDAKTTALGSTSAPTRSVWPSSTGRPARRARRTARSQRASSAGASTASPPPG